MSAAFHGEASPIPGLVDSGVPRDLPGPGERYERIRRQGYDIPPSKAEKLHTALFATLEASNLEEHIILEDGRKTPRTIDDYQLVPVLPENPEELRTSYRSFAYELATAPGVRFEYDQRRSQEPYLDSRIGVGLAYQARVVALCAGGLTKDGPMINQIHDVSRGRLPGEDPQRYKYSSGLHAGFRWRDTLIHVWHGIMQDILPVVALELAEKPTLLQSARNNAWIHKDVRDDDGRIYQTIDYERVERFRKGYDKVALRLGGQLDHPLGDFVLPRVINSALIKL